MKPRRSLITLVHGDVCVAELPRNTFEHIHAGLLFEYVDPEIVLARIARWLRSGGVLSTILQSTSDSSQARNVSKSPFTSLKTLESIMTLVDPDEFQAMVVASGLVVAEAFSHSLVGGKSFKCFYLEKPW